MPDFPANWIRRRRLAKLMRASEHVSAIWALQTVRRFGDSLLAAVLLLAFSPVLLMLLAVAWLRGGGIVSNPRLGLGAADFLEYEFDFRRSAPSLLRHAPLLFNIFLGDMAFVGPRPVASAQAFGRDARTARRYDLRPGLLSPWWLRRRANIAYGDELSLDLQYVETSTLKGDLGIALRSVPALLFGRMDAAVTADEVSFLGVRIDNLSMAESCQRIVSMAERRHSGHVAFVNADCFNIAYTDPRYAASIAQADIVLADGIGARLAGAMLKKNICENVNGTDMLPRLAEMMQERGLGLYLLGGKPGVAEAAGRALQTLFPKLRLSGARHGYFEQDEVPGMIDSIKRSEADVLLIAFGAPLQENWIADHRAQLGPIVAIGVGGLLDFYSGRVERAPIWMRELGLEWLFRFLQEPGRMWRRYFVGNPVFLTRVLLERWRGKAVASA